MNFPTFGELAELGGPGPSLGKLYQFGNDYIQSNRAYDGMAKSGRVEVVESVVGDHREKIKYGRELL